MATATARRLEEELNLATDLRFVYKFRYQAPYADLGSEHELCHVFLGRIDDEVRANAEEIAAIRFVSAAALDSELAANPERFTPWFKMEWDALRTDHAGVLEEYSSARNAP
jgi:isopentenyl-diphosphate delta-isomerase